MKLEKSTSKQLAATSFFDQHLRFYSKLSIPAFCNCTHQHAGVLRSILEETLIDRQFGQLPFSILWAADILAVHNCMLVRKKLKREPFPWRLG
ncbi:hypothetical protein T4E_4529 [Trichinella pseudospiralis]|uniref:Uncharacterized protein n=1 Tax=Trichinella pseudospiralis TaxID=6337 RepID=A0A0V0Y427_TRIPS|nr:hypothetical protein T4E_4529 [Trichinella pseudospiralis]